MFVNLAIQSLKSRKASVLLTIIAITISVFVLLSVEHIRHQAKQSFNRTISGVDLIVGPRTSQINLLLSSVFRLGSTGNAINDSTLEDLNSHPMVKWTVPIALGDSHKGHRVLGTTRDYFRFYQYGAKQPLKFAAGQEFKDTYDLVLGADIAAQYGYQLGQQIILSHGTGVTSFTHHDQTPFVIVGILKRTGTPVDQTLHVSLDGLHHMHEETQPNASVTAAPVHDDKHAVDGHGHPEGETHDSHDHTVQSNIEHDHAHEHKLSAVFVGLKARYASLVMQKWASDYQPEAIMAILPGVALTELWRMVGSVERVLQVIAVLVLVTTLIGLSTMLLSTLRERTREIAILRVLGASPWFLFALIELEVLVITILSCVLAVLLLTIGLVLAEPVLASQLGLFIDTNPISDSALWYLLWVVAGSLVMGLIPAINAYRNSLQANLNPQR